jgi:dimethylargininase
MILGPDFIALTHKLTPAINRCELTFCRRTNIDVEKAQIQHATYCRRLQKKGLQVIELSVNQDLPDAVFIEDTAIVVDEIAVMAQMGVPSRRSEIPGIASTLSQFRSLIYIHPPATLEGGDTLITGRNVLVGISPRTNRAGARSLTKILTPWGYRVRPVPVRDCIHLKSACTALDDQTLLINPDWLDRAALSGFDTIAVPESEPAAANALRLKNTLIVQACFPATAALLRQRGYQVETLDLAELMKAEGGVTCCSLIFRAIKATS